MILMVIRIKMLYSLFISPKPFWRQMMRTN